MDAQRPLVDTAITFSAPVSASVRKYFSSNLLWAAEHHAAAAARIEHGHSGGPAFDPKHRAEVISAVIAAWGFLEAAVNELFQDAYHGHGIEGDGYIAPLTETTRAAMKTYWEDTDQGWDKSLAKYQKLLELVGKSQLSKGEQPYQDAALVQTLRNALVHFRPQSLSVDAKHDLEKLRSKKFPDNALWAGASDSWWPSQCLGAGCAAWAVDAVLAFVDRVTSEISVSPNYARVRRDEWAAFGRSPAAE